MRRSCLLIWVLATVAVVAPPAQADHDGGVVRLAGPDRTATAAAVARRSTSSASTVVVAAAHDHPGALVGSPLARRLEAPVLLTWRDRLAPAAAGEIRRLRPSRAVIVGSERDVSAHVERDLRDLGVDRVDRVDGRDRFAVGAAVARRLGGSHVYVVEGHDPDPARGWPDALAVSALASRQQRPVLLVTTGTLPDATRRALIDLDVTTATVIGGPNAVSPAVADAVRDPDGDGRDDIAVDRVAGRTRYETARLVAGLALDSGASPDRMWLTTGRNWPDAIASGPAVAADGGVLLLVDGLDVHGSAPTWRWFARRSDRVSSVALLGGEGAVAPHIGLTARRVIASGESPEAARFAADRARRHAAYVADRFGPRPAGGTGESRARSWLARALRDSGWSVAVEPFELPQGGRSANVVAWLGHADPRGGAHVAVGAHVDTVAGSPGANDNASGVGALLALAEELDDEPSAVPVVLVGFGAEEYQPSDPPRHHIGSEVYAADHARRVAGMISVDMIGDGRPTCICWYDAGPSVMAERLDRVRQVSADPGGYEVRRRGDISDHGPFARRGVPAAFLWTGTTAYYHTSRDTSGHLDARDMQRSGDLVLRFVRGLRVWEAQGLSRRP